MKVQPMQVALFLNISKIKVCVLVAQLDRVSDSDSEGRKFESCRVYHTPVGVMPTGVFYTRKIRSAAEKCEKCRGQRK